MNPSPSTVRIYTLGSVVCLGILTLIASQIYLTGHFSWTQAWLTTLVDAGPWMILIPIVFRFSKKFPIEKPNLKKHLSFHIILCLLLVIFIPLLGTLFIPRHPQGTRPGQPPVPPPPPPRMEHHSHPFPPPPPPREKFILEIIAFRSQFHIPIFWMMVGLSHALGYYQKSQLKELRNIELEKHLTQAKLQSLQLQLQPHFLFNTLNSISALVHQDPDSADEMICNLSEMLRQTLKNSSLQEVPLSDELKLVDLYLSIQQIRFKNRLQMVKHIPPELLSIKLPQLILQPLVENAFRHGMESRPNGGILSISASSTPDRLRLVIEENDGHTPHFENTQIPIQTKDGIGLSNTLARLRELYGEEYSLALELHPQASRLTLELPK